MHLLDHACTSVSPDNARAITHAPCKCSKSFSTFERKDYFKDHFGFGSTRKRLGEEKVSEFGCDTLQCLVIGIRAVFESSQPQMLSLFRMSHAVLAFDAHIQSSKPNLSQPIARGCGGSAHANCPAPLESPTALRLLSSSTARSRGRAVYG